VAKREGKSVSDYLRDLALSERAPAPEPDTRPFARTSLTTKADLKRDTITEKETRDRIRLRELRESSDALRASQKSQVACPMLHSKGAKCKFCGAVG
jgi:hypothetical protein